MIGNGYCNDESNNPECVYDGGDCCGSCMNTDHCSECACRDENAPILDLSCKCLWHQGVCLGMTVPRHVETFIKDVEFQ